LSKLKRNTRTNGRISERTTERPGKTGMKELERLLLFIRLAKKKALRHFLVMIARARN